MNKQKGVQSMWGQPMLQQPDSPSSMNVVPKRMKIAFWIYQTPCLVLHKEITVGLNYNLVIVIKL